MIFLRPLRYLAQALVLETTPRQLAWGFAGAGVEGLDWPNPVRPGGTLRCESEVVDVRPSKSKPDRGLARIRTTTYNQRDEPVLTFIAKIIVPLRRKMGLDLFWAVMASYVLSVWIFHAMVPSTIDARYLFTVLPAPYFKKYGKLPAVKHSSTASLPRPLARLPAR